MSLADQIKDFARQLGFDRVGIAPASHADGFDRLNEWLARGFAGDMAYMQKLGDARRHPKSILADVRSVVMVALNYRHGAGPANVPLSGKIAQYALGPDYHDVLRDKLNRLLTLIQADHPQVA